MSEVTPLPKPAHYEFVANGSIDHIFDWYSLAQLQAYGAAEYQRAIEDAAKVCEDAVTSIWDYHDDNRKEVGKTVCWNLSKSIRALGAKK